MPILGRHQTPAAAGGWAVWMAVAWRGWAGTRTARISHGQVAEQRNVTGIWRTYQARLVGQRLAFSRGFGLNNQTGDKQHCWGVVPRHH